MPTQFESLFIAPCSRWSGEEPEPQRWVVAGLIPAGLSLEVQEAYRVFRRRQHALRLNGAKYARVALAEVFWREFEEFATSRKIQKYKLQLVGLTSSATQPGFIIELDKGEQPAPETVDATRVSVTDVFAENPSSQVLSYFEEVDLQSKLKPETSTRVLQDGEVDLMQTHFSYDRSDLLYALFRTKRFWIDKATLVVSPIDNAEYLKGNDLNFALTHGMKSE